MHLNKISFEPLLVIIYYTSELRSPAAVCRRGFIFKKMIDWIPRQNEETSRLQFMSYIAARPTDALFRGGNYSIRVADPSQKRKMELAAFSDDVADLEAWIALSLDAPEPQANRAADQVSFNGSNYRIISVQSHFAKDCYILTLTKLNY